MRSLFLRARCAPPLALLALAAAACGTGTHPLLTSEFGGGHTDASLPPGDDAGSLLHLEAGVGPQCNAGPEGGVCGCLELSLLSNTPNLFFVLDRSGSMSDQNKWQTVRGVVADVIHRIGPRARFGAAIFPSPSAADSCTAGIEVMAPRQGDSPAGTYGPTTAFFTTATNVGAGGGTPTAATLVSLAPTLSQLPGKTYVILATDGGPNCDSKTTCDVSACILNIENAMGCPPAGPTNCCKEDPVDCLDTGPTVQAITALASAGLPTYVIGVPGSGPYAAVLDQMAIAGGTARPTAPYYYAVDTADSAALAAALSAIAAQVTGACSLTLDQVPEDPTHVNVYLDGVVVPQDPANGWTIAGATVMLVGDACQRVLSGNALSLRVVAGCPTVLK